MVSYVNGHSILLTVVLTVSLRSSMAFLCARHQADLRQRSRSILWGDVSRKIVRPSYSPFSLLMAMSSEKERNDCNDERLREAHRITAEKEAEWYHEFVVCALGGDYVTSLPNATVEDNATHKNLHSDSFETIHSGMKVLDAQTQFDEDRDRVMKGGETIRDRKKQKVPSKTVVDLHTRKQASAASPFSGSNTDPQIDVQIPNNTRRRKRRRPDRRSYASVKISGDEDLGIFLKKSCRHVLDMQGFRDLLDEEAAWRISVYSKFLRKKSCRHVLDMQDFRDLLDEEAAWRISTYSDFLRMLTIFANASFLFGNASRRSRGREPTRRGRR